MTNKIYLYVIEKANSNLIQFDICLTLKSNC